MFATVKKIRAVGPVATRQIPPIGKVLENTEEWRSSVQAELAKRERGEQAKIVRYVQRWYPRFSTGTMSGLLMPDERPGELRHSKYIALINRFLWPDEAEVDPSLMRVLRTMPTDEQRALAEFLATTRKPK